MTMKKALTILVMFILTVGLYGQLKGQNLTNTQ